MQSFHDIRKFSRCLQNRKDKTTVLQTDISTAFII